MSPHQHFNKGIMENMVLKIHKLIKIRKLSTMSGSVAHGRLSSGEVALASRPGINE